MIERVKPEEVGISSTAITKFIIDMIDDSKQDLHTIMIMKDNKIIAEKAIEPYSLSIAQSVFSLSKTFVMLAIGIAIDEGIIELDGSIVNYLYKYLPRDYDENLDKITIKDCLLMCNGHGEDNRTYFVNSRSEKILEETLKLKLDHEPKEKFCYNSVASFLLACCVKMQSGENINDYLTSRLYNPLGIDKPYWQYTKEHLEYGAYGIKVKPEDLIKIGLLIINDGVYEGKRIISKEFLNKASQKLVETNGHSIDWQLGYGLHIWQCRDGWIRTDGYMGQFLLMSKEHNMVVVMTAATEDMGRVMDMFYEHLPKFYEQANHDIDLNKLSVEKTCVNNLLTCHNFEFVSLKENKNKISSILFNENQIVIECYGYKIKAGNGFYEYCNVLLNEIPSVCASYFYITETRVNCVVRILDSPTICVFEIDLKEKNIQVSPNFNFSETSSLFFKEKINCE